MDIMRGIWVFVALAVLACAPAMAAIDEGNIMPAVQNISVTVPPTMTGVTGSQQSMTAYAGWLEQCSQAAMSLVNQVMKAFGQKPLSWSTSSVKTMGEAGTGVPSDAGLTTVATITGSGDQIEAVTIPRGEYWEIRYTADPLVAGASSASPALSIWIYDGLTGNDIERVEPPGGFDTAAWAQSGDPRPWTKQFTRGNGRSLYFEITATSLKSYTIEVRAKAE